MKHRRLLATLLVAITIAAAACTSTAGSDSTVTDAGSTTTTIELPDLEFGRGIMPASVPASWPMPVRSTIGSTMIDGTRGLTEVVATFPANVSAVVDYYTQNLPILGYEVTASGGTDGGWRIEFAGEGVTGELLLSVGGSGITAGTMRFVRG